MLNESKITRQDTILALLMSIYHDPTYGSPNAKHISIAAQNAPKGANYLSSIFNIARMHV